MLSTACYTVKQGYYQTQLLFKREPIDEVISQKKTTPERLEKLKFVPIVLAYAREKVGLTTGKSYTQFIALEEDAITFVVQAAEKRSLTQKTWWFPIVGTQPYLGFFKRNDAVKFQKELVTDGYDTTMGGVQAFSLLGYFPDPIYSSMLDNNQKVELAELLFHECTHLTLYIPNYSAFNENLADFVARKAVAQFFSDHPEYQQDLGPYFERHQKTEVAQKRFREFLKRARASLDDFYTNASSNPAFIDNKIFLEAREQKFNELADAYLAHMDNIQKGTRYEWSFRKGRINNAVVLGYSLYEEKQDPFEPALNRANGSLRQFLKNLERCLKDVPKNNEDDLWQRTQQCGPS